MEIKQSLHAEGPMLSRIVAGAWRWNKVDVSTVERLVGSALDAGVTSFDHADIYGDYENEALFGKALKRFPGKRQNIELVTKCGIKLLSTKHPKTSVKHYDTSKEHIIQSVDQSLKKLGTDHVNLLLLHRPDPLLNPTEVADAFTALRSTGKALHFGVSNFTIAQFEMLQSYLSFPLVTNQIEVSLGKPDSLFDGTLDALMKRRVSPMAWSPLAGGKLMEGYQVLWEKKEEYQATDTQMLLAWLLRHPANIFPIIGTTQPERIKESAKALSIKLDRQHWFEMLRGARGVDVP